MGVGSPVVVVVPSTGKTIARGYIRRYEASKQVWPNAGQVVEEVLVRGMWVPLSWCIPAR